MALPPRRASVLLLVALALAANVFSSADAARAPKALEAYQEAGAPDGAQLELAPTGSGDAMTVEHVVVVDKRGGGGGGHGGGGGGHGGGGGGGHGGGEGGGHGGFGGAGYHGYGNGGRGHKSASSGRNDGVWKVGAATSVLGAAAWML